MTRPEDPQGDEALEQAGAVIGRLFRAAAHRAGGTAALGEHLDLDAVQLRPYLAGEAIPSAEILLRTVELVLDQLDTIARAGSAAGWHSLTAHYEKGLDR
jgi:hypothetical protein